jgi:hypothetical protein
LPDEKKVESGVYESWFADFSDLHSDFVDTNTEREKF